MKKHLMTKLLVIAMLLISVLGISAKTASAQIILPEQSRVWSWGFGEQREEEILPHTTFPMTEKQHHRKSVRFTVFADHFGGCQLYINKAFVPLSYYQMNEQQLASGRYELTITINDGEYQDVTQEFINAGTNSVIDSIPADKTYTYTFRVKGSPESPASLEQVVNVYPPRQASHTARQQQL